MLKGKNLEFTLNLMNHINKKQIAPTPPNITNNNISFCQFKNELFLAFASKSIFASGWYFKIKWPYVCFKTNSEKGELANFQTQTCSFLCKIKSVVKFKPVCCLFTTPMLPHGALREMFSDWGCQQRLLPPQAVPCPMILFGTGLRSENQQIMDAEGSHLSERSWSGICEQKLCLKKMIICQD